MTRTDTGAVGTTTPPRVLADAELAGLQVLPAGLVNLRRDLFQLVRYVQARGLRRTVRGNAIPKADAQRLARLLTYAEEEANIREEGCGLWSEFVCSLARDMGLVTYDIEGRYAGYSSMAPSFRDNDVVIVADAWRGYLHQRPTEKERALLDAQLASPANEFFHDATLLRTDAFELHGSRTGPVSRMDLPRVRRNLLEWLARLAPERWYEFRDVVEQLREEAPTLILDPATRGPDRESHARLSDWERQTRRGGRSKKGPPKPPITLEDLYVNFRECPPGQQGWHSEGRQLVSGTPEAFHRVEGRYLASFLCGIPYNSGFVGLAFRAEDDPHGMDVGPAFERLRAFRLTRRLAQVLRGDAALDALAITVLPNFDVLVEAPSYPESAVERLERFARVEREDGPVLKLRLDQKRVAEATAASEEAPAALDELESLATSPIPQNVRVELASWSRRGEQVVFFDGAGLVELDAAIDRAPLLGELGDLHLDDGPPGFVIVRDPEAAFRRLEDRGQVPVLVRHRGPGFAGASGWAAAAAGPTKAKGAKAAKAPQAAPVRVTMQSEDLVGYRTRDAALLEALCAAVAPKARTCVRVGPDLLVVSAAALPELRAALRALEARFTVSIVAPAVGDGGAL
jgi:hypothetical protein